MPHWARLLVLFAVAVVASLVAAGSPALAMSDDSGWFTAYDAGYPAVGFSDVDFVDTMHGWAVGDDGAIFATVDGGVTWKAQTAGITATLDGVAFSDAQHGWAVADYGILSTVDGGVTWSVRKTTTGQYALNDIACTDALHACAVGSDINNVSAAMLTTSDGGKTWDAHGVSDVPQYAYTRLTRVTFVDVLHGWAVGGDGTVVATTDGGTTWATQRQPVSGQSGLNGVEFVDPLHGWAVGDEGTILATADGGAPWVRQDSWVSLPIYGVSFTDLSHGWVVGWDGVLATKAGGQTWLAQPLATMPGVLYAVDFVDASHGWAVDGFGRIYGTRTGGKPDTRGPVTRAKAARGRRGKPILLRFKITDDTSTEAFNVRILVKHGSKTVMAFRATAPLGMGVWHRLKWTSKARGKYRYSVYAKDKAGNPQSDAGSATVVVR